MFFAKNSIGSIAICWYLFSSISLASTLQGRFVAEGVVACSDGSKPDFREYNAIADYQLIPFAEAHETTAPVIWLSEREGIPVIAVPVFVRIDHWTCPPNGNSSLVHREFYYHSLYSHDGSFGGEYNLIGSHPSNNFTSAFLYLGGDLTEDISDEITFHMDERIDGAIEKFSYHGPKKSLAMSIAIRAGESSFQVTFKKVCLEGIGDLSVNYVAAEESP